MWLEGVGGRDREQAIGILYRCVVVSEFGILASIAARRPFWTLSHCSTISSMGELL